MSAAKQSRSAVDCGRMKKLRSVRSSTAVYEKNLDSRLERPTALLLQYPYVSSTRGEVARRDALLRVGRR